MEQTSEAKVKNSGYTVQAKRIILKLAPPAITDVHGIVEAYDYLAVVRTLDPDTAIIEIVTTPDTFEQTLELARIMEKRIGAEILHPLPA